MPGIDHTTYILYRYLKELSVKISYGSCLLYTSDAADEL